MHVYPYSSQNVTSKERVGAKTDCLYHTGLDPGARKREREITERERER